MDRNWPSSARRRARDVLAASAVAAAVLLAGCGGGDSREAEPVVLGSIPPDTGAPIGRDLDSFDESGLTAFDAWPSACDLIDDAALRSLFPELVDIARQPRPTRVTVLDVGGENRVATVPEAECTVRVGLPQEGLGLGDDNGGVRFETSVIAVGEPDAVDFVVGERSGEPIDLAGVECLVTAPFQLFCDRETFAFQVTLDLRAHGQYVGSSASPYESSGTTVVPERGAERDQFIFDRVLRPVVENILARDV